MNDDRDVQPRRRFPDRRQLGIVDLQPRAVGLLRVHAGLFENLEADRAVLDVGFELRRGLLCRSRARRRETGSRPLANTVNRLAYGVLLM